mgnify:CR=1 FL=1
MKHCIVQLARGGDILSILPLAQKLLAGGDDVAWLVHPRHAALLDIDPRIERHLWDGRDNDVEGAAAHARKICDKIIVPQVNGQRAWLLPRETFQLEQWDRAGALSEFRSLPLDLSRRPNCRREVDEFVSAQVGKRIDDGNIYVVGNFSGMSAPFENADIFSEKLGAFIRDHGFKYIDVSNHRFSHPAALADLLYGARSVVTIDTLLLHFTYGTETPVFALLPDCDYSSAEVRDHWLGFARYHEALERVEEIGRAAIRLNSYAVPRILSTPGHPARYINHIYSLHSTSNPECLHRYQQAEQTWRDIVDPPTPLDHHWQTIPHVVGANNAFNEVGDIRALPKIHDIFDFAVSHKNSDSSDIFVITNSDSCLVRQAPVIIRDAMRTCECCWSTRCDVSPAPRIMNAQDIEPNHTGADLFAFTATWWENVRDTIPPMYFGAEGWDWVIKQSMRITGGIATRCIVFHEAHHMEWAQPGMLENSPANQHNRKMMRQWAELNKIEWRSLLPHPEMV